MRGRLIVALALIAIGLVWIGQGLGMLRGSGFMVDDIRWAVIGAILIAVGAALAVSARRARPKA
jgi:hypothetical protein